MLLLASTTKGASGSSHQDSAEPADTALEPGAGHRVDVVAVEQHPTGVRPVEPGDNTDQRRLTGAAGPCDRHERPGRRREADRPDAVTAHGVDL